MDIVWKLLLDQRDSCADDCIWIFPADKEEVPAALCQVYPLPFIDLVGIYNNVALGRLTENMG